MKHLQLQIVESEFSGAMFHFKRALATASGVLVGKLS